MKARLWCMLLASILYATQSLSDPSAESEQTVEKGVPTSTAKQSADKKGPDKPRVVDRLDLDSTQVTGNRELPKVMVIVPWKHAEVGNVAGRPANSLMDEVLRPLDRDVLRREIRYFEKADHAAEAPPSKPEN